MPRIGQSMEEGTIVEWHFAEGERVNEGDVLVSIETDKATYDLEAPASGVLHIVVPNGEEVPIETLIATIGAAAQGTAPSAPPAARPEAAAARPPVDGAPAAAGAREARRGLASPRARSLAAEHGLDLAAVPASAADGVVSVRDVEEAIARRGAAPAGQDAAPARPGKALASPKAKRLAETLGVDLASVTATAPDGVISAEDVERAAAAKPAQPPPAGRPAPAPTEGGRPFRERSRLTGIRRTAARRLQESWQTIPHIVQMVDVDASGLVAERRRLVAEGMTLSLNDLILQAATRAMVENPAINGTVEGDELCLYDGVDVGFAVDSPRGLTVPVIRGADRLSLAELAAEARRLIEAAQAGRLTVAEMGQASVTVSNLGMFGIRAGTPVINPGEPVLVFVGAVEERPASVSGAVVSRPGLTLSIAYDHRVADGVAAARYTQALKQALEALPSGAPEAVARPEEAVKAAEPLQRREARSHASGPGLAVEVESGGQRWVLDEPADMGGNDEGPTPVEAFLGALLGCMTISFRYAARRRGLQVDRVEGWVAANATRHVQAISLELQVWSPEPEEKVRALLAPAERGCFVSAVLKPELDYTVDLYVHSTAPGATGA
jgi:pyruvate/2-oxoglutarate dehydrogenase complex dihydrolipoamide acyltransferase (E2) component/uncharacterized OsmC-like protein